MLINKNRLYSFPNKKISQIMRKSNSKKWSKIIIIRGKNNNNNNKLKINNKNNSQNTNSKKYKNNNRFLKQFNNQPNDLSLLFIVYTFIFFNKIYEFLTRLK